MVIVQDPMSGIETVSSNFGWETTAHWRTEILSDLQCHCLSEQEKMVEAVRKRMELLGI